MWIRRKIRWEYDRKSPAWITTKYGINTAVYVQSTVDKRLFTVRLQLFTEHRKLSLGYWLIRTVSRIQNWHWCLSSIFRSDTLHAYTLLRYTFELIESDGWTIARLYWLMETNLLTTKTRDGQYDIKNTIDEVVFQFTKPMQTFSLKSTL